MFIDELGNKIEERVEPFISAVAELGLVAVIKESSLMGIRPRSTTGGEANFIWRNSVDGTDDIHQVVHPLGKLHILIGKVHRDVLHFNPRNHWHPPSTGQTSNLHLPLPFKRFQLLPAHVPVLKVNHPFRQASLLKEEPVVAFGIEMGGNNRDELF